MTRIARAVWDVLYRLWWVPMVVLLAFVWHRYA